MLRDAWFIASRDVWLLLRTRETLIWSFLMPVAFVVLFGAGLSALRAGPAPTQLAVYVGADAGFLADEALRRLAEQGFEITRVEAKRSTGVVPSEARGHAPGPTRGTTTVQERERSGLERHRLGLNMWQDARYLGTLGRTGRSFSNFLLVPLHEGSYGRSVPNALPSQTRLGTDQPVSGHGGRIGQEALLEGMLPQSPPMLGGGLIPVASVQFLRERGIEA